MNSTAPPVILFDGICNLCNASVDFVIKRDRQELFRFASLQGKAAQALLREYKLPSDTVNTVILVEGGKGYIRSTAALRIARHLPFPWPLLSLLLAVPPFIRDLVYDVVARNRHRWFGRADTCRVPAPELRARFLD